MRRGQPCNHSGVAWSWAAKTPPRVVYPTPDQDGRSTACHHRQCPLARGRASRAPRRRPSVPATRHFRFVSSRSSKKKTTGAQDRRSPLARGRATSAPIINNKQYTRSASMWKEALEALRRQAVFGRPCRPRQARPERRLFTHSDVFARPLEHWRRAREENLWAGTGWAIRLERRGPEAIANGPTIVITGFFAALGLDALTSARAGRAARHRIGLGAGQPGRRPVAGMGLWRYKRAAIGREFSSRQCFRQPFAPAESVTGEPRGPRERVSWLGSAPTPSALL